MRDDVFFLFNNTQSHYAILIHIAANSKPVFKFFLRSIEQWPDFFDLNALHHTHHELISTFFETYFVHHANKILFSLARGVIREMTDDSFLQSLCLANINHHIMLVAKAIDPRRIRDVLRSRTIGGWIGHVRSGAA